jgi:hypothetical protein
MRIRVIHEDGDKAEYDVREVVIANDAIITTKYEEIAIVDLRANDKHTD